MSTDEDATFPQRGMAIAADDYLQRCRAALDEDGRLDGITLIATLPAAAGRDEGVLWLGGWCEASHRRNGDVVLLNPWDARESIDAFEDGCWQATRWLAGELAPRLNQLHEIDLAPAYWDMLTTPWLLHMVSVVTERYLRLTTARRLVPAGHIAVGPMVEPPRNGSDAIDRYISDSGNLEIFSRIALACRWPTSERSTPGSGESGVAPPRGAARMRLGGVLLERAAIRGALKATASRIVHGRHAGREVLLLAVPFASPSQVRRLRSGMSGVRAGSVHELAPRSKSRPTQGHVDRDARSLLTDGIVAPGELEVLLARLVPDLIPRSFVEDYEEVTRLSRARYGSPCPTVIGNYFVDEPQNEYLGRVAASGSRIAFAQHGGSYRQSRVDAIERLEVRDGGTFLSWGWEGPGARRAASPKLAQLKDTHRGGDKVLIVEVQLPRYVLRFNTWPLAEQTERLTLDLGRFVRETSVRGLAPHLLLKPATDNDTYGHVRSPDVDAVPQTDRTISPYATDWMKVARIAVVTYPATSLIEAMVIGVPMIGLWDRARWEERDDASSHFEHLEHLGVLFADPEEAAERLGDVYSRATEWWLSADIQTARRAFLQRFARTESWLADWRAALAALKTADSAACASGPHNPTRR